MTFGGDPFENDTKGHYDVDTAKLERSSQEREQKHGATNAKKCQSTADIGNTADVSQVDTMVDGNYSRGSP